MVCACHGAPQRNCVHNRVRDGRRRQRRRGGCYSRLVRKDDDGAWHGISQEPNVVLHRQLHSTHHRVAQAVEPFDRPGLHITVTLRTDVVNTGHNCAAHEPTTEDLYELLRTFFVNAFSDAPAISRRCLIHACYNIDMPRPCPMRQALCHSDDEACLPAHLCAVTSPHSFPCPT